MNDRLKRGLEFATKAHGDQKRKYSGRPYIEHPIGVARMLSHFDHDENILVAAILHDTVEDTHVSLAEVGEAFGNDVLQLLSDLTDVSHVGEGNRRARKERDLEHTSAAQPQAKTIKALDLAHNAVSIVRHDNKFARIFLKEMEALMEVLENASDPRAHAFAKKIHARALNRLGPAASPPVSWLTRQFF
jgi:(p)ppGpp synthase/HD superfamily hydrolase